jgi:16S rRNA (guanine527-N7)-methyltransferase
VLDPSARDALVGVFERGRAVGLLGPGPVDAHLRHAEVLAALVERATGRPRRFCDLGTGAGVPGLVLAHCWPDAQAVLLDARRRAIEFVADAVVALGLAGRVEVAPGQVEDWVRGEGRRESFDLVVARSVAPPPVLAELAAPLVRVGGHLVASVAPGGGSWSPAGLAELGFGEGVAVATDDVTARITPKVRATPETYPRAVGRAAKRPMW